MNSGNMVQSDDTGFKDRGFQRERREKGLEIAMRHKEDAVPLPGLRIQTQRNHSVPKRATKEAVYLKDRQVSRRIQAGEQSEKKLRT